MATYHVDENGNNGNSGADYANAWLTLQHAVDNTVSGDTVVCHSGTSTGTVDVVGKINYTIETISQHSYKVLFGGPGARSEAGIRLADSSLRNITIKGLEITSDSYMPDESKYLYHYNTSGELTTAHPSPATDSWAAVGLGGSMNRWDWNGSSWVDSGGFDVPTGYGIISISNAGIHIEDCHIHDCGGNGIGLAYLDWVRIKDCLTEGNARWDIFQTSGISIYEADDIAKPAGWDADFGGTDYNIILQGNTSRYNRVRIRSGADIYTDGNGIILDDFDNTQGGRGGGAFTGTTIVDQNTVYENGFTGIQCYICDNCTIQFNTVYRNRRAFTDEHDTSSGQNGEIMVMWGNNNLVRNNIAVVDGDCAWTSENEIQAYASVYGVSDAPDGNTWENNLAWVINPDVGNGAATWNKGWPPDNPAVFDVADGNILNSDPLFTDASNGVFTLTAGSPAIGSASDSTDMGAYQYSVGGNILPVASFTSSETEGTAPLTVNFDASTSSDSDGTIVSYSWNWGDATASGSGITPSHTFTSAGSYDVVLTVTDDQGGEDTHQETITVSTPSLSAKTLIVGGNTVIYGGNTIIK